MKNLFIAVVMLFAGAVSAQTTTINGETYHGVSGDKFITIASAWNNGDITDAWDWNNLIWILNGVEQSDVNTLSGIAPGGLLVRHNGVDIGVSYVQIEIPNSSEYFVIPSLGRNGFVPGEGTTYYNAAVAAGLIYSSQSEATRVANRLTVTNEAPYQVWSRSSGGYNRQVTINGENYIIATRRDATGSFPSAHYISVFSRTNPFNLLVANNWTTGTITDPASQAQLSVAIHPSGNYAVLSVPGGAYNSYNYANGALGRAIARHNSPQEVLDYNFGG